MKRTLALIHTSQVFLSVETMMKDLFAEILPDVRLINIMDDSLLPDVMAGKVITPAVARRMAYYIMAAEAAGADAVLSLCSSLGPAIDATRSLVKIPVIKIDDAHTEKAVTEASKIGVMATVVTTLQPTVDLIRQKSAQLKKPVDIQQCLVDGAFETLMKGDKAKHDAMVMEAALRLAPSVECILFAQASMTRLADQIGTAVKRPIHTSPRLAIELTKRVLQESPGSAPQELAAGVSCSL